MTSHLEEILARFVDLTVLVVGDVMLDSYLVGSTTRLCQEAPVPVVAVSRRIDAPGGAGNVAANVCALGARAVLVAAVGTDAAADGMREALGARGVVADDVVVDPGRRTIAKQRVISDEQMMVRFDEGSTGPIGRGAEAELLARLRRRYGAADAVIVADYGYGVVTPRVRAELRRLQAATPRVLLVDAKSLDAYRDVGMTVAKPNYEQALRLTGPPDPGVPRARLVGDRATALLERTGARVVVVTLDADGAVVLDRDGAAHRALARPIRRARAAGAGDTFGSAYALALAAGAVPTTAADLASVAAGVVVGKDGTAVCAAQELADALRGQGRHLTDLGTLVTQLDAARRDGKRIVLTNGCFDILHRGHITYLNMARELGDVLVVGLNSDEGVRRLKGAGRPINGLEDRAEVLAALSSVDHLVRFDEDTPVELIRAVRPHVFVKGGNYTREGLPEAAVVESLNGVVRILPFVDQQSTSGIISRIRETAAQEAGV